MFYKALNMVAGGRLVVATDGSCLGNPGPGGWAWAVDEHVWAAGSNSHTTNNLMELRAVYEALSAIPREIPLLIQADSQYVINVFEKWLPAWRENGWRTSGRKPVASRPNIELIATELDGRDVLWEHVYGHRGHPMNEFVDRRARAAAEAVRDHHRLEPLPNLTNIEWSAL
ncbi:MAG: ribonuclease H [Protaetiibacter sp.]